MADENGASDNSITQALEGGLPQLLLGPAGKAVSRLIGAAVEIPAGWLDEVAQASKDRKEAKSKVMQAIAKKSAELAVSDPKLLERGLNSLLSKAYREQENREAVANEAIEQLKVTPPPPNSEGPSDDWLNVFEEHAAKASSENLRALFGQILAGEVRKPGSFSLATMHLVSVLDQNTAALMSRLAPYVIVDFVFRETVDGKFSVRDLVGLEDAGVITGSSGTLSSTPIADEQGLLVWPCANTVLKATFEPNKKLRLGAYILTKAGIELMKIIAAKPDVTAISKGFWKAGALSVQQMLIDPATKLPVGWMDIPKPAATTVS